MTSNDLTRIADDQVAQRLNGKYLTFFGAAFGEEAVVLLSGELHLRVGGGERDAGLETCGGLKVLVSVGAVGLKLKGQPDVRIGIGEELLSDHAHDRIRLIAQREPFPDDGRIAAEAALPEAIAQHHYLAAVGRVLQRRKGAAQHGLGAEETEVALGNVNAVELFGPVAGEVEAGAGEVVGGNVLEYAGLPLVEMKHRNRGKVVGKKAAAIGRIVKELDHAVGIGVGEGLEQNRVDYREDGGVGSDAQRQSGQGGEGKAGVLEEHLQRVLDIVPEIAHASTPFSTRNLRAGL